MATRGSGTFDITITPEKQDGNDPESAFLGKMSFRKQFHGDLEGTSRGEMLAVMTPVKGSAGYVAMERVSGKLDGQTGSFVLQHSGTMTRGVDRLDLAVVPDSGAEQLEGISGRMTIRVEGGKHYYEFEYSLPARD